jgi:ElaA protein
VTLVRSSAATGLRWRWTPFSGLGPADVYELLQLRQDVFLLEQRCFYRDADGLDLRAWHGLGTAPSGELVAYARLLPPTPAHDEPSIGRVVVTPSWRAKGVGRELMKTALEASAAQFPGRAVQVSAQAHLERFYAGLGFVRSSPIYDDAGIPHCTMRRVPQP